MTSDAWDSFYPFSIKTWLDEKTQDMTTHTDLSKSELQQMLKDVSLGGASDFVHGFFGSIYIADTETGTQLSRFTTQHSTV